MISCNYKTIIIVILFMLLHGVSWAKSVHFLPNPDKLTYEPLHFIPPRAERIVLENGIVVHFLEDHELPLLSVAIFIKAGSLCDPDGKEGLSELTATVMRTGGTATMSGDTIDEVLDDIAAELTSTVNKEYTVFYLSTLTTHTDQAVEILSRIITHPVFEDRKFNRAKELKMEELRRIADDPERLAFKEFIRIFYKNHPRGKSPLLSSIQRITRDDLYQHHKRFFHPHNTMIAVSGNITRSQLLSLLGKRFSTWEATHGERPVHIPPPAMNHSGVYFLQKEIPQSIIISGQFSPPWGHPDSFAFSLIDFIVGSGGFQSRIPHKIRNEMGLAYSAGSFYRRKTDHGVFGIYSIVRAESTVSVLEYINNILNDIRIQHVKENEIKWAKNSLINNFIFAFVSAEYIAQQQLMIELENLPEDYLVTYRDNITSVTDEKIKQVISKYMLPAEKSITLITGNGKVRAEILSTFKEVQTIESRL